MLFLDSNNDRYIPNNRTLLFTIHERKLHLQLIEKTPYFRGD